MNVMTTHPFGMLRVGEDSESLSQTTTEASPNEFVEKLAHLIKICGFLMQTKVYFAWRTQSDCYMRKKESALIC